MDVCFACEKEGPGKWIPEGEFICDACAASSLAKYGDWRADRCNVCDEHEVCDVEAHERVTAAIIFGFLALGTWAAARGREHRLMAMCAEINATYAPTFERLAKDEGDAVRLAAEEDLF